MKLEELGGEAARRQPVPVRRGRVLAAPCGGAGWVEATLSGSETVALAWLVLLGFVRLSTHPAVFERPLESGEALDLLDGWLDQPGVTVVHPTDRHGAVLRELLEPLGTAGNLTSDAHLAALAIEHGALLALRRRLLALPRSALDRSAADRAVMMRG